MCVTPAVAGVFAFLGALRVLIGFYVVPNSAAEFQRWVSNRTEQMSVELGQVHEVGPPRIRLSAFLLDRCLDARERDRPGGVRCDGLSAECQLVDLVGPSSEPL